MSDRVMFDLRFNGAVLVWMALVAGLAYAKSLPEPTSTFRGFVPPKVHKLASGVTRDSPTSAPSREAIRAIRSKLAFYEGDSRGFEPHDTGPIFRKK